MGWGGVLVRDFLRPAWSDGGRMREKVRPAHEKWPKIGGLWRAGRILSRMMPDVPRVGRIFLRCGGCGRSSQARRARRNRRARNQSR